ncbi:MAG: glycosyltransferase [Verrucomicrobia bacterium]|nr:glycosyltransferase [Verrucomicrobiota bacterium]
MKVSIVIPAFNEEKLLPATLQSVQAAMASFTARGWETELVVCDNNSTDRTADLARAVGARVVFEPVNQIARARNTGAKAASGDWLVFIDADSHPMPELLAEVADQIQSGGCLAGGTVVTYEGHNPAVTALVEVWNCLSRTLRYMAGSFIFCEAGAFREVGGFSEELFASEEIDLSRRLKKLARRRGKQIVILHRHPLVTSARKFHLYTPWEHLRFLARTVLTGKRSLRTREACPTWYDGRR